MMANVSYGFSTWQSGGPDFDLPPGGVNGHFLNINGNEVVSISVHPARLDTRYLVVENIVYESGPLEDGHVGDRVNFDIRNAGTTFITGYEVDFSLITA